MPTAYRHKHTKVLYDVVWSDDHGVLLVESRGNNLQRFWWCNDLLSRYMDAYTPPVVEKHTLLVRTREDGIHRTSKYWAVNNAHSDDCHTIGRLDLTITDGKVTDVEIVDV